MTFKFDKRKVGNVTFMDTPGLDDIKMRKQAALAISEALRQDGVYQVVFIVTLEAGRVRPADVCVINLVLESAPEVTKYSVVFNKLSKDVVKSLKGSSEKANKILTSLNLKVKYDGEKAIFSHLFLGKIQQLDDKNDVTTRIADLEKFMTTAPIIVIHSNNVKDIELDKYEKYVEQLEVKIKELQDDNKKMLVKIDEDKKENARRLQEIVEEEKQNHKKEIDEMMKTHENAITKLLEKYDKEKKDYEIRYENNAKKFEEEKKILEEQRKTELEELKKMHQRELTKSEAQFKEMQEQNKKIRERQNESDVILICSIS